MLSAFIPALTYYPAFALAGTFVKPSAFLPQGITNQIMVWAIINGLITLAADAVRAQTRQPEPASSGRRS